MRFSSRRQVLGIWRSEKNNGTAVCACVILVWLSGMAVCPLRGSRLEDLNFSLGAVNAVDDFDHAGAGTHRPPFGQCRPLKLGGQSGIRKILKPGISGNPSAASADTKVSTAAVTSPLPRRSKAVVCPALTSTEAAPATTNAIQTSTLDAEYFSSIATLLPASSVTDLISGRAITTATRELVLPDDSSSTGSTSSGLAAKATTVIRSATPVAAATCSRIVLSLEFGAGPAVGREAATLKPVVAEPGLPPPFGSGCVLNERGWGARRAAGGSAFAAATAGFTFLAARWPRAR